MWVSESETLDMYHFLMWPQFPLLLSEWSFDRILILMQAWLYANHFLLVHPTEKPPSLVILIL